MWLRRLAGALALSAAMCAPALAAPLSAYGKLPNIEDVAVSPSGHALAMIVTDGEQRALVVHDLATNKPLIQANTGDVKVRGLDWAGDKHLVVVTSTTAAPMSLRNARREWASGHVFDLETRKVQPLLRNIGRNNLQSLSAIAGTPEVRLIDGKPVIFVQGIVFEANAGRRSIFRNEAGASLSRLLETGREDTVDWFVDHEGRPVAQELQDDKSGRWSLRLRDGGAWREVASAVDLHNPPVALGLGRDGKSILVSKNDDDGHVVWQETGLSGPIGPAVKVSEDHAPIYERQDGRLIGYSVLVGEDLRYTFFDANDARIWRGVQGAYPGSAVRLVSWSRDRKKVVVSVDSPTEGPAYAIVDLDLKKGRWIGSEYLGLKAEDIAIKQPVAFKAADGLALTGYLILPRGRLAKDLPLVVFPHGGPAARDEPGYDWWAQGMASRGYAVLQVNFRGSDGLGPALREAGCQWGRKMQTDLSDGVRHLAKEGIIDPKRVCIVGASYGGYAALAGATLDRGIYRCAVSVAGVSDLRRQVAYSRSRGGQSSLRFWTRFMGAEDLGDPILPAYSPASQAAKADIPILLIHGKDDTVVPLEQSQVMATALTKAGKSVEMVVQPGADHWLSRGDTRLQTLEQTVGFLEKHNPPR